MKRNGILALIGLIIFTVGFFAGMEYKAYQVRTALQNSFSGNSNTSSNDRKTGDTVMQQAKEEKMTIIQKAIGDEVILATLKLKVNSIAEKQTLSSSYSSPKVAKQGTKFVVVNLDVTNITNSAFTFFPDDGLILADNQNREYKTYSESIGAIDKYLNSRDLSPSIKEAGFLVYEIPTDATSYGLVSGKTGTNELYKIVLK